MPVTITLPSPGPTIGPGFNFSVDSDFIGPLGSNPVWSVTVSTDPEGLTAVTAHFRVWEFGRNFWMFGGHEEYALGGQIPSAAVTDGADVHVVVELRSDLGLIDTGAVSAKWSSALADDAANDRWRHSSGAGLTPTQDATLSAIAAAVTSSAPLSLGIGHYAAVPVIGDLVAHAGEFALTSRGTLTPPSFAGVPLAVGILVKSVDVPAGFGLRDGFIQTFRERVGQFAALRLGLLSGVEVPLQVLDVKHATEYFQFPDYCDLLGYDVTPGCTLHCQWVTPITP